MIQLTLSRNVLDAFAALTAARASALDPLCAVHIRRVDEFAVQFGAGNGDLLFFGRLVTGGELLKDFFWDPDEDPIISLKLNDSSTSAFLGKSFKTVSLKVYHAHAVVEGVEEEMTAKIEIPRIRMDTRNLFAAMSEVARVTLAEITPRGQLYPPVAALRAMERAGKALGVLTPREIAVAQLGQVFSLAFGGGQADWWGMCKCRTTVTDGWAGMPPDWINGEREEAGTFEFDALHVLDTILGPEQAELPLEDAPEREDEEAPEEIPDELAGTSEDGSDESDLPHRENGDDADGERGWHGEVEDTEPEPVGAGF